tara:strand:- start:2588 stop:2947 length:360 start_codon:yes stop_codon:yes gene_type:complete
MIKHQSEIEIIFVSGFYDWPLTGICKFKGKTYKFKRVFDEQIEDYNEYMILIKLNTIQRLREWCKRTYFGICVGFHEHYKNGKRYTYYHARKPRWFWKRLFNLYYREAMIKRREYMKND